MNNHSKYCIYLQDKCSLIGYGTCDYKDYNNHSELSSPYYGKPCLKRLSIIHPSQQKKKKVCIQPTEPKKAKWFRIQLWRDQWRFPILHCNWNHNALRSETFKPMHHAVWLNEYNHTHIHWTGMCYHLWPTLATTISVTFSDLQSEPLVHIP